MFFFASKQEVLLTVEGIEKEKKSIFCTELTLSGFWSNDLTLLSLEPSQKFPTLYVLYIYCRYFIQDWVLLY